VKPFAPRKILHIDLSGEIPDLMPNPAIGGLYLVFWSHGIALGHVEVLSGQLPMPAAHVRELAFRVIAPAVGDHLTGGGFDGPIPVGIGNPLQDEPLTFQKLRTLKRPLEQLDRKPAASPKDLSGDRSVSVVICTRNRPSDLERCLRSLRKLSSLPDEIVVVDNAPLSDTTRRIVSGFPEVRYCLEPRPGLSPARNTGVRLTSGSIVAFTDDDVVVHPDWILHLRRAFTDLDTIAMTGLILPAELDTEAQYLFQSGEGVFNWGYKALVFDHRFFRRTVNRGAPAWLVGAGANMAFRRRAFELVGDFDERLGSGRSGCGEDSEFWYRLLAEGWKCRYDPKAIVFHYHRRELRELERLMYFYMRGHVAALFIQFERYRHWGNLHRVFAALPFDYLKQIISRALRVFKNNGFPIGTQILGCASGIAYYIKHRHQRVSN
jgi:GT2 family glycosyltransferase